MHRRQICKVHGEGASTRVTIPRAVATQAGISVGDYVAATVIGECIVLMRVDDAVERHVITTTDKLLDQLLPART